MSAWRKIAETGVRSEVVQNIIPHSEQYFFYLLTVFFRNILHDEAVGAVQVLADVAVVTAPLFGEEHADGALVSDVAMGLAWLKRHSFGSKDPSEGPRA